MIERSQQFSDPNFNYNMYYNFLIKEKISNRARPIPIKNKVNYLTKLGPSEA